ncbi:hypothetical protein LWI28_027191 [Acer negundo]|uniref:Uncharacterized protein n=1 Tax=Acer negundo TaxID=4023 RepID=A0AAD5IWW4_ACENE|nr:hypothetical protein LWI28_027191 [Acer negundo]
MASVPVRFMFSFGNGGSETGGDSGYDSSIPVSIGSSSSDGSVSVLVSTIYGGKAVEAELEVELEVNDEGKVNGHWFLVLVVWSTAVTCDGRGWPLVASGRV